MAAIFLLLLFVPVVTAVLGYAKYGVTGAVIGGLGGLVVVLIGGGVPFGLMLRAERRKYDAHEAERRQWMSSGSPGRGPDPQ